LVRVTFNSYSLSDAKAVAEKVNAEKGRYVYASNGESAVIFVKRLKSPVSKVSMFVMP
jgi:hypothetical protein